MKVVLNTKNSNDNNICELLIDTEIASYLKHINQLYKLHTNKI